MPSQPPSSASAYDLVSGAHVSDAALAEFSRAVWPDRPPERIFSSWWRRAGEDCSVAAVHRPSGAVAGLCAGRPSRWMIADEIHSAVALCDWYVAPDHMTRMLGLRLLRSFEKPDTLLYAFSLSDDARSYLGRIGWAGPHSALLLALPLPRLAHAAHAAFVRAPGLTVREHAVYGSLPTELAAALDAIEAAADQTSRAHMLRGAAEWSWRVSLVPERRYDFSVAYRGAEPLGYAAVRPIPAGSSRMLGRIPGALLTDLSIVADEPAVARVLAARSSLHAGQLGAAVLLAATTSRAQQRALGSLGFLSSRTPAIGRVAARRAPKYMWLPKGPGARLELDQLLLTFADSDVDFRL